MRRNYDDPVYKKWRKEIYKRDNFKCQMPQAKGVCGCKYRIQAHHIKKWSAASILRYDVDNGITLCRECHEKVSGLESHYETLFQQVVNRNKNG
jgi:5-methylcytosine-specific restriction endonuclease McrA